MTTLDSSTPQPQAAAELPQGGRDARIVAAERTVWRLTFVEFPWDINKALEFALLRTYAVPSISGLLARTGEFKDRPAKRYDDTALLIREVLRNGLDSERGRRAFGRINAMHGRFRIAGDDFLYVLSTFVFSPLDWLDKFGRRALSAQERQDWFVYWREFGRRMGLDVRFETLEAFETFARGFEAERFVFAPSNKEIAKGTIDLVLSQYLVPASLHDLGRPAALALCEPALVKALGFDEPPSWLRAGVGAAMRARREVLRRMAPNRQPNWLVIGAKTYPEGYNIEELGTFPRAPV